MTLGTYYSEVFHKFPVMTGELQDPIKYNFYTRQRKYIWIRREERDFRSILRNPTVGCWVELSRVPFPGSVLIDSLEGKKLIKKMCYF